MTRKVVISEQNMGGSALFKIPYWDHTFTAMNNCYHQDKSNVGFFHLLWQLAKEPTKKSLGVHSFFIQGAPMGTPG